MIEAVIFDMDGLLVDSEPIWCGVEARILNRLGVPVDNESIRTTTGMRIDEIVGYWYQRYPWEAPSLDRVAQDIIDGVVMGVKAEVQFLPGAQRALSICAQAGLPLALASSSRQVIIDAVLDKLDLRSTFAVVRSAQDELLGKPNPAINISTAEALCVSPTKCLILEDSVTGVISAKAAKAVCIAVPAPKDFDDPRFSIADLILSSLEDFSEDVLASF